MIIFIIYGDWNGIFRNFIRNTTAMLNIIKYPIYLFILFAFVNCKQTEDKELIASNQFASKKATYDNALEVPVGKVAVLFYIDSLGVFNQADFIEPVDSLRAEMSAVSKKLALKELIVETTERILKKNNYNFELLTTVSPDEFIDKVAFQENKSYDGLKSLKLADRFEDIILVQVRSGLTYDQNEDNKLAGKTNIYFDIIDAKTNFVKYSELITGSKYLNRKDYKTKSDFIENLLKESLVETINILDTKY